MEYERRIRARIKLGLMTPYQARSAYHRLPWANISQRHPDYGMTADEHAAAEAQRQEQAR